MINVLLSLKSKGKIKRQLEKEKIGKRTKEKRQRRTTKEEEEYNRRKEGFSSCNEGRKGSKER